MARDYFSMFPKTTYVRMSQSKLPGGGQNFFDVEVSDILVKYKIRDTFISNANLFYPYLWKDSDRPDTVAHRYYGSEKYHWVVFYSNGSFDLNYDFPMPQTSFRKYIAAKYRENSIESRLIDSSLVLAASIAEAASNPANQGKFIQLTDGTFYSWINYPAPRELTEEDFVFLWVESTTKFFQIEGKYEVDEETYLDATSKGDLLARSVSFFDYEDELNESKRSVQLLDNEYFLELVRNFRNEMSKINSEREQIE